MIDKKVAMFISDKIVEKINNNPNEMSRFLQANPYTAGGHDFFTFGGIITPRVFFENLYYEGTIVENKKEELLKSLLDDGGKNTIFILGYLGCGKTTFINSLLEYYCDQNNFYISPVQKIVFDEYGVKSENDPIKSIFAKSLRKIIENCDTSFENFTLFYRKNNEPIRELSDFIVISNFYKYVRGFLEQGKSIKIGENCDDCLSWLEEHCSSRDLFYLIALFSLSNRFNENESDIPVVIFMDNLDYIDEHEQLEMFSKIINDFTIDISKIFNKLYLYKNSNKEYRYTNKIKLIIAMRETTKAVLPPQHFREVFSTLYTSHDITEWYEKDQIVNRRLDFLGKSSKLSSDTQKASSVP